MMLSKNEIKYIQSLCHKKHRQAEGLFIAEGPKVVTELLESDYRVRDVYAVKEWISANPGVQAKEITPETLEKISALQAPNQVLAVAEQRIHTGEPEPETGITLALDGIRDPGNMGTIIRIADWFGISQIVAGEDTVELYNPKVIQATMGSFMRVRIWYKPLASFLTDSKVPVYGALLNGTAVYEQPPVANGILVIGNESKGIREDVLPLVQHALTIPRIGGAESLNAAVATGILLSHLTRK